MKKKCKCRICGKERVFEIYQVKEMMRGVKKSFSYFWCTECDCLQIENVPENLGDYYYQDYYSYQKPPIQKGAKKEKLKNISILDVGCGAGWWLCEMAEKGYENLWGCDPFIQEELHYENGVTIKKCSIHEIHQKFDQIYFHHSFEHMTDPHEVLQQIFRLLKNGGVCEISIPVVPNLAFELFQENWFQLDAPRHIFLHSPKSIAYLAEKANLKLLKTEYDSNNNQFLRSMLYREGIPFERHTQELYQRCFTKMDIEFCAALAEKMNKEQRGDMAVFSFRKKTKAEILQGQKEEQEEVSKERLLMLMEEAVSYLIQERENGKLEAAGFLLDDLLEASRVLYTNMIQDKK